MFCAILVACFALNTESLVVEAADKAPMKVEAAAAKVQPTPSSTCAANSCCTRSKTVTRSCNTCGNKCASSCGSCKVIKREASSCRGGIFKGRLRGGRCGC